MKNINTLSELRSSLRVSLITSFFLKTLSIILLMVVLIGYTSAQPPLAFQKCYGGTGNETAKKFIDMNGNGFLVFGETTSNNGDVSGNHGGEDIWVFRNDNTGNIVWQKCFGGSGYESLHNVYQTTDGGYILVATTTSNDGDVSGNSGGKDIWVFKIDSVGNLLWQNSIGGSGEEPYSTYGTNFNIGNQLLDIYFSSISNDGEMSAASGGEDIWNVSVSTLGNTNVQAVSSSMSNDELLDVWNLSGNIALVYTSDNGLNIGSDNYPYDATYERTTDGGYIVGYYYANSTIEGYSCAKFSNTGISQGGGGIGILTSGAGSGYLYSGYSYSFATPNGFYVRVLWHSYGINAGATGDYDDTYLYDNDATVVQSCRSFTDDNTGDSWSSGDCPIQITGTWPTPGLTQYNALEGGFIGLGTISSQLVAEKRTLDKQLEWTKSLGGTGAEYYAHYIQRPDSSYWVLGSTNSNNGDVSGNHGNYDIWLTYIAPIWLSTPTPTICTSGAATLTLNAGSSTSAYTWQQSTNGGASWYSVSGTNPTTTSTVATLTATRLFRVIYTSAFGIDTTPVFTLNVVPDPTVILTASNNNFCAGGYTTLTATLNGGVGTGIYQWQKYNGTTWNNIPGATNANYTTPVLSANANYKVISSQTGLGCVTLGPNTINVLVKPLPNIDTNPDSAHIINGTNVTLHAYNAASYEWSPATGLNTTTGATVIASPSTSTTYAITGTGANGCSKTIYLPITVSYSTDIEENLISQFSVFPNPADKNIKISMNTPSAQAITFSISDVLGKELKNWEGKVLDGIYEQEISIENLSQGIYFLSAKVGEKTITQKFVKE